MQKFLTLCGVIIGMLLLSVNNSFAETVTQEEIQNYEKSCNLNEGLGCYNLGFLYDRGQGVKQNYFKAKEYYEKACNLNNNYGCFASGILYYLGHGVKQDTQKAKEYYGKACDLKFQLGCEAYAKLNK